jgi:hypothetical protein
MTDALHAGASSDQIAAAKDLQSQAGGPARAADFETAPHTHIEHGVPEADLVSEPPRARAPEERPTFADEPAVRSPGDQKRVEMQARFRDHRAAQEAEEALEAAEIEAMRLADPNIGRDEPTRRVIVRGQVVDLTESELIAAAQKGLAADSYGNEALAEARAALDEVKRERAALEALRNGSPYQQTHELPPAFNQQAESGDQLDDLVHELQYGTDPTLAKEKLKGAIANQAQADRERVELERSKVALQTFTTKHQALSRDDVAMAVVERLVHQAFEADLRALNFDLSQFPNPQVRANLHLKMRANGHNVRPIGQIFERAKEDYERWRNGGPAPRPTEDGDTQPLRRGEPRVIVNVDRTERRKNIPTQPPRTASPLRAPQVETPDQSQLERRTNAAQQMIIDRRNARNGGRNSIQTRR